MPFEPDTELGGRPDRFPVTRHSLVDQAGDSPPALAMLVELYWKPVYKHLRLKWHLSNDDAKELTQSAFAEMIEAQWLEKFDVQRGTFRTYLRTCVDAMVLDWQQAKRTLKRGGGLTAVEWDFASAERDLQLADPGPAPDEIFEREWRREILASAISALRAHCEQNGYVIRYAVFAAYDLADAPQRPSYAAVAAAHALPVGHVNNHLAWARRELRRLALELIESTAASRLEARHDARSIFGG